MKKLILIVLLIIAGVMFTNAHAASKVTNAKNALSARELKATLKIDVKIIKPTYYVFSDNGSLWLLTIYDNGNSSLTWLGPILY